MDDLELGLEFVFFYFYVDLCELCNMVGNNIKI
jgi:hypothetical protein